MKNKSYYQGKIINFTLDGTRYSIKANKQVGQKELENATNQTRKMLGYIVYPRWYIMRSYLSDVIEMFKKNNIYKHQIKKLIGEIIKAFDSLEVRHYRGYDSTFLEVMSGRLLKVSLNKIKDIRGSIGGVLMNNGIKNYVLYSYPYFLVNLCYDNLLTYDFSMKKAEEAFGINLSEVFLNLKGEDIYDLTVKLMKEFIKVMGEDVSGISLDDANCLAKFEAFDRIVTDEKNLNEAFQEAYSEIPEDIIKKYTKNGSN